VTNFPALDYGYPDYLAEDSLADSLAGDYGYESQYLSTSIGMLDPTDLVGATLLVDDFSSLEQ